MPCRQISPSRLMFDRRFWQNSIRLDKAFIEDFCSRLLNRPISRPIRFELIPFSQPLELAWQQAVKTIQFVRSVDLARSSATLQQLQKLLAALILVKSHPHNYSELLRNERTSAEPQIIREAEINAVGGAERLNGEVAKELRVQPEEPGARISRCPQHDANASASPIPLQSARQALASSTPSTTVTSVRPVTFGFASCALQPLLPIRCSAKLQVTHCDGARGQAFVDRRSRNRAYMFEKRMCFRKADSFGKGDRSAGYRIARQVR